MHRPTRHALSKDNYIDIDMVNASQRLFMEVCKQNKIKVPAIKKYCAKRDEFIDLIKKHHVCNRDTAKKLIISLSFGGGYAKFLKDNNLNLEQIQDIVELEKDYEILMEHVWKSNNNIIDDVLKSEPDFYKDFTGEEAILKAKKELVYLYFIKQLNAIFKKG